MHDRHCIVTGGRSGIGAAVVEAFVKLGATVSSLDLYDREGAGAGWNEFPCDVSQTEAVSDAVRRAVAKAGSTLDVLVNCAGITQVPKDTLDADDGAWQRVIDINLKGTFIACREAARYMLPQGSGAIVNIASVTGMGGFPKRTAYGPSKAGVINLTEALSLEWADRGIRVNAISPGYVETKMIGIMIDGGAIDVAALLPRIPMKRMAAPAEIAAAVVFLASPAASYITGATLPVDGGWTANRAP